LSTTPTAAQAFNKLLDQAGTVRKFALKFLKTHLAMTDTDTQVKTTAAKI
jgi:hypothetical protein